MEAALIFLLVVVIACGLALFAVRQFGLPSPFNSIALGIIALIALFVLVRHFGLA